MTTYYVTQVVHFTFKVEANDFNEAIEFANQQDFDSAYEYHTADEAYDVSTRRESMAMSR